MRKKLLKQKIISIAILLFCVLSVSITKEITIEFLLVPMAIVGLFTKKIIYNI